MGRVRRMLARAVFLALAFRSPAAGAEPAVHLAWDDCGAAGHLTRTFACNTNSGAENLVVSFVPPAGVDVFTGIEVRLRFWPPAASLPPWWGLSAGGCRSASLRAQPFAAAASPCVTPWTTNLFFTAALDLATQELRALVNLNQGEEHSLDPAVHYYGVRLAINHAKSTGSGRCDGCSLPVGVYVSRFLLLIGGGNPNYEYALPQVEYVNWQCDGSPVVGEGSSVIGWSFPDCATPARGGTWGGIKALYR